MVGSDACLILKTTIKGTYIVVTEHFTHDWLVSQLRTRSVKLEVDNYVGDLPIKGYIDVIGFNDNIFLVALPLITNNTITYTAAPLMDVNNTYEWSIQLN